MSPPSSMQPIDQPAGAAGSPGATGEAPLVDQLLAEYLLRLDAGETLDREAFLQRCPEDLRAALREVLETADLIDVLSGSAPNDAKQKRAGMPVDRPQAAVEVPDNHVPSHLQDTVSISPVNPLAWTVEPVAGQTLGDYELMEEIGRGGMGVVFKARQRSLNRVVAVKMILAGRFASQDDVRRFLAEAQAAGRVDHPNIVTVYQIGQVEGHHFFSMDHIDGPNLADLCREGPLEAQRAARYLKTVAEAIEAAHREGILHRDLKPANILIDRGDRPCVTDFGLAKSLHTDQALTNTGAAIGTPSYMPPEQACGDWSRLCPASDVYSLGAILYVMLTGQPPFRGGSAVETIYEVVHHEPQPPRRIRPQADPLLETICLKCLAKDPADRYATAQELADDLQRYLQGEPVRARPMSPLRKAAHWTMGIPIVAALLGRHVLRPTPAHQRAQAAMILLAMAAVVILVLGTRLNTLPSQNMPDTIRIASGRADGEYYQLAQRLAPELSRTTGSQVEVINTSGSVESSQLLEDQQAHVALLQAASLHGDQARVIAPVCYEVVHVIVRRDHGIRTIEDLQGRRLCLGSSGSGSRLTAESIVRHYGLNIDETTRTLSLEDFRGDARIDGVIVTIGLTSEYLSELLATGKYRLVPLPHSENLDDRTLEPFRLPQSKYPQAIDDPAGLETVKTPAFLVTSAMAPTGLVEGVLQAFYGLQQPDFISPTTAASWTFLPWHRGARQYYERLRKEGSATDL